MTTSATAVRFDDNSMLVELSDGRTLGVPYAWFPRLLNATPKQREAVEIGRFGLHWEDIDEDISIAGLLAGRGDQTVDPPTSGQADSDEDERRRVRTSKARMKGRRSLTANAAAHHGAQRPVGPYRPIPTLFCA